MAAASNCSTLLPVPARWCASISPSRARSNKAKAFCTPARKFERRFNMASDILIVDDEADIRELVSGILEDEGFSTRTARNSDEALTAIEARRPNLIFLDIWMQGSKLDGLQLLESVKRHHPDLPIVMISGHGNIETAVTAIRHGAYDFIEKPFKADRLVLVAERALETSRLRREVTELKARSVGSNTLVGHSAALTQLRQLIERVAPANSRILITGATRSINCRNCVR